MVYDTKKVAMAYVEQFGRFINEYKLGNNSMEDLYGLFSYSLNTLNLLATRGNSFLIENYGADCIMYLKKTKRVPKRVTKLSTSDRVGIVTMSLSYFVAVGLTSNYEKGVVLADGYKESL